MLLLRSLLFNLFLYVGIASVFLIALPAIFMPIKVTLLFGKFLGYYVVFIVRICLSTKVEFKGIENIPKNEKYFVLPHISLCLKHLRCKVCLVIQFLF